MKKICNSAKFQTKSGGVHTKKKRKKNIMSYLYFILSQMFRTKLPRASQVQKIPYMRAPLSYIVEWPYLYKGSYCVVVLYIMFRQHL